MKNVIYATGFFCIIMSQAACSKGSSGSSMNPAATNEEMVQQCVLATKGSVDCNAAVAAASTPQGQARLKALLEQQPGLAEVSSTVSQSDIQARAQKIQAALLTQTPVAAATPNVLASTPSPATTIIQSAGSRSPASVSSPQSASSASYQPSSVASDAQAIAGGGSGAEGDAMR